MQQYVLTATIWREGRHFVSRCAELGVASFGKTPAEALERLHEAVELFIENALRLGILGDVEGALCSAERFTAPFQVEVSQKRRLRHRVAAN